MKIALFMNPTSAKGRGETYRERFLSVARQYPVDVEWITGQSAEASLVALRNRVAAGDLDALIVAGGDGTIHMGVNAIGDSGVPLGVVAIGSGNDIARQFKLPIHRIEDSLHQVMSALFSKRFREVDVIEVEGEHTTKRALAVVSAGLDAQINQRVNELSWPKGNMRYIRGIVDGIREYEPYGARLTINGKVNAGSLIIVSAANTRFFGGGFEISPGARPDDGLLDVAIAKGLSMPEFGVLISKLVAKQHIHDPRVHIIRTREFTIENAPEYGAPLPMLMADGEELMDVPATVRVLERKLTLLI